VCSSPHATTVLPCFFSPLFVLKFCWRVTSDRIRSDSIVPPKPGGAICCLFFPPGATDRGRSDGKLSALRRLPPSSREQKPGGVARCAQGQADQAPANQGQAKAGAQNGPGPGRRGGLATFGRFRHFGSRVGRGPRRFRKKTGRGARVRPGGGPAAAGFYAIRADFRGGRGVSGGGLLKAHCRRFRSWGGGGAVWPVGFSLPK